MVYDLIDTGYVEDREPSKGVAGIPVERFTPASYLSNPLCYEMALPTGIDFRNPSSKYAPSYRFCSD